MLVRMDLTSERSSVWDILFKGQIIRGKNCIWTNQPMASPYNIKQNGEHFKLDAELKCPRPMCPWPKVLGCCAPWTKRFWEKNRIKRYNFVRQNFCQRWSDRKNLTKISCTDEAIKLVKFCAIKRYSCLYKHIFLAMKRYNRYRWSDTISVKNIAQQKIYFFFRNI